MSNVTIKFENINIAKIFATAWSRYSLRGYDMSHIMCDGSVSITMYNVKNEDMDWILENHLSD